MGETIRITEAESKGILLVPEIFRGRQSEIISRVSRDSSRQYEIKFISNKQSVKVFGLGGDKESCEMIHPAIIEVLTISNSDPADRLMIVGAGMNSTLKVKLDDNDAGKTYAKLSGDLQQLGLNETLPRLVSIRDLGMEKNRMIAVSKSSGIQRIALV